MKINKNAVVLKYCRNIVCSCMGFYALVVKWVRARGCRGILTQSIVNTNTWCEGQGIACVHSRVFDREYFVWLQVIFCVACTMAFMYLISGFAWQDQSRCNYLGCVTFTAHLVVVSQCVKNEEFSASNLLGLFPGCLTLDS